MQPPAPPQDFLARISHFSPKRLALLADDMRRRLEAHEEARHAPVAVVGIGCRFPGGASTPEAYWELLARGGDAITEVPADRWDVDAYYDPNPDAPGKISTRWGGFLDHVDQFDPHFFGISPREAQRMDPQQRLLLEVAWEALEHAGVNADRLAEARASVFVGMSAVDYVQVMREAGLASFDAYTASGGAHSIASGRLSYLLGARGPSVSVDTACSSSMVAIHQAVQSLRRGESDLALAGGVNLILRPDVTVALSRSHMMAPDGRCKAFDARADGFVRGEGCGVLVLKRLADARRDGDRVIAVVRGSAANQDGRSNGLTAPNGPAQESVLRDALADARLAPGDVQVIEAHGTGTSLGDPIEVRALAGVFGDGRPPECPLLVGSVKANIGHLEAAAGVASVIKMALALERGVVPAQQHFREPNPFIPWDEIPVRVPTVPTPWPAGPGGARVAGVSSFGFSGTNVHVLLSAPPQEATTEAPSDAPSAAERPRHVLAVSARNARARDHLAAAYREVLAGGSATLADVAHSANVGRAAFPHRLAVVAATADEAVARLDDLAAGVTSAAAIIDAAAPRAPRVAFLFTGQGAQAPGMARALYDAHPRFRAEIDRCDALLRDRLPRPLLAVLFPGAGEASPIDDTEYTQPALFAVEWALAQLWLSWGVRPVAVTGHSLGEYVAACVAGVMTLEDALALVAERGRLMGALPRDGAMAAVMADEARVAALTAPWQHEVSVAAVNGPAHVVVSGRAVAIDALVARATAEGLDARRLAVSHAFHSPLVEPVLDAFERTAASVTYRPAEIDVISNVTGERMAAGAYTAAYWREHARAPVQFARAVEELARMGCDALVEVGPHPTLLGMARHVLPDADALWLPSLRRGADDWAQLLGSVAALWARGANVDWIAFDAGSRRGRVVLPTYPFQRERYWVEGPAVATPVEGEPPARLDALLDREVAQAATDDRVFETRLSVARFPYLVDHRIFGALLLPSPVLMETAREAAHHALGTDAVALSDFAMHGPLPLADAEPVTVQAVVGPTRDGASSIRVASLGPCGRRWTTLVTGTVGAAPSRPAAVDVAALRAAAPHDVPVDGYYAWLASIGLEFGPRFRGIAHLARGDGAAVARMRLPEEFGGDRGSYGLHPALLDACFHVIGAAMHNEHGTATDAYLLTHVERLSVYAPLPTEFWAHVRVERDGSVGNGAAPFVRATLRLVDDAGAVLAALDGVQLQRATPQLVGARALPAHVRAMLHEIAWREAPPAAGGLPAPALVRAVVTPHVADAASANGIGAYAAFGAGLDRLAAAYVVRAFRALGADLTPGACLTPGALAASAGVLPRHERLVARLFAILAEDGVLAPDGPAWRVAGDPDALVPAARDPEAEFARLRALYPDGEAELTLTARCARELAPVLRGDVDPLALLFPGGSLGDMERLYQTSAPARTYNTLVAEVVDTLRRAWPGNRPLRVLEIGAGTGSTTAYVLPKLAGIEVEYTFTDVSPLFLTRARDKFRSQSGMRYATLDIGVDPAHQGIALAHYDVVIGANVLHATPDLGVTLAHARALLAPGGQLVLLEGTTPQRFGDLTVGLLDGWWAYTDVARRQYALMPRERWLRALGEAGFAASAVVVDDDAGPVLAQQAIFVAQTPAVSAPRAAARWLIVADAAGTADTLAGLLRADGDDTEVLASSNALRTTLRDALTGAVAAGRPVTGVVHLAALDAHADDATSADALWAGQQHLVDGALAVAQTLARVPGEPPALWLVTRGAQSATAGESADPAQATMWGLSHVVALEHPELRCHRVDLDPSAGPAESLGALAAELRAWSAAGASGEDQVALRGARRLVRRLVPQPAVASGAAMPISSEHTYLVTGGLRGLGPRVAEWLVGQGARSVVLMGRRAPDAAADEVVRRLTARGARVVPVQGDVSRETDVRRVLDEIARTLPPLRGVVHAAGALDDGVLAAQTWERFATAMAPKVLGTWHLHRLCGPLDFLALFSSGASVAGSPGQANHAAANAFEDALAAYRQARGLPTVSINWGPWAEVGAAADRQVTGPGFLRRFAPEDGLLALEAALRRDEASGRLASAQVAVLAADWSRVGSEASGQLAWPLFRELAPKSTGNAAAAVPLATAAAGVVEPSLRDRLRAAAPVRRRRVLQEHVRALTVRVLGISQTDALDVDEPLRQLGLDSLMAVELRNLLARAAGRTVPAAVTFDHPSVSALTDYLAAEAFAEELGPPTVPPLPTSPMPAALDASAPVSDAFPDGVSDDELALRLAERLDRLMA